MLYLKIILIALMLFLHNVAQASNQLVFSTGYFFIFEKGKNIVSQIYQKLDYDIVIKQYPDKRALKMSNNGEVDGELLRIKGMQQYYPNLRMVPTAIDQLDALALSIDLDVEMVDWQDLQPYKVGIINGIKYAQIGTHGMQVHPVDSYQELFNLLVRKRVDVIVCTKFACDHELKKLQDNNIKSLGILQKIPLYHYLHRKHEKLIPLLNEKILQMHKED